MSVKQCCINKVRNTIILFEQLFIREELYMQLLALIKKYVQKVCTAPKCGNQITDNWSTRKRPADRLHVSLVVALADRRPRLQVARSNMAPLPCSSSLVYTQELCEADISPVYVIRTIAYQQPRHPRPPPRRSTVRRQCRQGRQPTPRPRPHQPTGTWPCCRRRHVGPAHVS